MTERVLKVCGPTIFALAGISLTHSRGVLGKFSLMTSNETLVLSTLWLRQRLNSSQQPMSRLT